MNLHVLIWAPNYVPVDISALFLSYSAGWSHCLLLDLLWQFQKWTPFEVQHRHSPKKRQWTWSDIPLRQKMPRHIASNIADNIYCSMITNYSISYEGRNIIPEVLWKYMLPSTPLRAFQWWWFTILAGGLLTDCLWRTDFTTKWSDE